MDVLEREGYAEIANDLLDAVDPTGSRRNAFPKHEGFHFRRRQPRLRGAHQRSRSRQSIRRAAVMRSRALDRLETDREIPRDRDPEKGGFPTGGRRPAADPGEQLPLSRIRFGALHPMGVAISKIARLDSMNLNRPVSSLRSTSRHQYLLPYLPCRNAR
jgi:hypothetical protein